MGLITISLKRWSFGCQFLSLKLVKRNVGSCSQRQYDLLPLKYDHMSLKAVTNSFILIVLFKNWNPAFKTSYKWSCFNYLWKKKMKQSLCAENKLYLFFQSKSVCLFSKFYYFLQWNYWWMALIRIYLKVITLYFCRFRHIFY